LAQSKRKTKLYPFLRDSSIQRFEFTFEIFWKLVKTAMRELFKTKYVNEEELKYLLKMVDDINLTVHTYNEELAEELFNRFQDYANLMKKVVENFKKS